MSTAPVIAAAAAGATAISLPFVRRALLGGGVLDHANSRSSHMGSTPRGGGLGVLVGLVTAVVVVLAAGGVQRDAPSLAVVVVVCALAGIGFCDDVRSLAAIPRLLAQLAAGLGVGLATSVGQPPWVLVLAVLGSAVVMVFIVNTVNFMDGINGMTASTVAGWGAVCWWAGAAHTVPVAVAVGAAAVGTALAFLPFNVPRAALFLGDVGSYLYGALVASTSVVMIASDVPPLVVAAPLVPYAADVVATLARRVRRGESLTQPHRDHLYQLLTRPGRLSHVVVAGTYGSLTVLCGALAILAPLPVALTGCAVVALLVAAGPHLGDLSTAPGRAA